MARGTTESSFDELASGLASGSLTRGKALRLMGAALLGGTLTSFGMGEAGAEPPGCKRNGKKCKKDSQCCSGACVGGTCQPAGTQFTCICAFTQELQTCSALPCDDPDSLRVVCAPLCEQQGSVFTGGTCDNVPCEV
jgi:hypothetical protein